MNNNIINLKIKENILNFKTIIETFFYSPLITSENVSTYYDEILPKLRLNFKQLGEILVTQSSNDVVLTIKEQLHIIELLRNKDNDVLIVTALDLEICYLQQLIYFLEYKMGNVNQEKEMEDMCNKFILHFREEAGEFFSYKTRFSKVNNVKSDSQKVYIYFENQNLKVNLIKQHSLLFLFCEDVKKTGDFTPEDYMEARKKIITNILELYYIIKKQNSIENLKEVNEYQEQVEMYLEKDKTPFSKFIGKIEIAFCQELVKVLEEKQKNNEKISLDVGVFIQKLILITGF